MSQNIFFKFSQGNIFHIDIILYFASHSPQKQSGSVDELVEL